MPSDLYCSAADLRRYGYSRGALANPARAIAAIDASTEILTLDDHGLEDGDAVVFRVEEGGTMPAPLVAGTTYYARDTSSGSTFAVSATASGSAINITAAGSDVLMTVSLADDIDLVIEKYSRLFDVHCIAHQVPFEAGSIPSVARSSVAEASAAHMLRKQGQASEMHAENLKLILSQFKDLAKGIPLRDAAAPGAANLAVTATASTLTDPRGWYGTDATRIP